MDTPRFFFTIFNYNELIHRDLNKNVHYNKHIISVQIKKNIKQRLFELIHFNISGVILDISFVTLY